MIHGQFVESLSPITNYLTRDISHVIAMHAPFFAITHDFSFSGITAPAPESITTTIADVQARLRTLVTPSTILLCHSLELDLHALQLSHPWRIDTTPIFHDPHGRSLKPGSSMAYAQLAWSHNAGSWARHPRSRRGCVNLCGLSESNG
jgi:hypothetical protein